MNKTICAKHDKIIELSNVKGNEDIEELFNRLNDIYRYALDAKEDGQNMEKGLDRKRKLISELEDKINDFENQLEDLKNKGINHG